MEDNITESRPQKCPARAIVSMILGIFSVSFSAASGMFIVYIPVMKQIMRMSSDQEAVIAGRIFNGTFLFCAFLFIAIAAAAAIVSLAQGKKFEKLYEAYGSKMVKAGRITSIVGLILAALMFVFGIICLIL